MKKTLFSIIAAFFILTGQMLISLAAYAETIFVYGSGGYIDTMGRYGTEYAALYNINGSASDAVLFTINIGWRIMCDPSPKNKLASLNSNSANFFGANCFETVWEPSYKLVPGTAEVSFLKVDGIGYIYGSFTPTNGSKVNIFSDNNASAVNIPGSHPPIMANPLKLLLIQHY